MGVIDGLGFIVFCFEVDFFYIDLIFDVLIVVVNCLNVVFFSLFDEFIEGCIVMFMDYGLFE